MNGSDLFSVYVFLGDNHGLIDFCRLLKQVLGDKMSEYVVISVDERLYTNNPLAYLVKCNVNIHTCLLTVFQLNT